MMGRISLFPPLALSTSADADVCCLVNQILMVAETDFFIIKFNISGNILTSYIIIRSKLKILKNEQLFRLKMKGNLIVIGILIGALLGADVRF